MCLWYKIQIRSLHRCLKKQLLLFRSKREVGIGPGSCRELRPMEGAAMSSRSDVLRLPAQFWCWFGERWAGQCPGSQSWESRTCSLVGVLDMGENSSSIGAPGRGPRGAQVPGDVTCTLWASGRCFSHAGEGFACPSVRKWLYIPLCPVSACSGVFRQDLARWAV